MVNNITVNQVTIFFYSLFYTVGKKSSVFWIVPSTDFYV